MADELETAIQNSKILPTEQVKKKRTHFGWLLLPLIALIIGGVIKTGAMASPIGTSLDDGLTQQFQSLGGVGMVVICPPSAKFYAGATIVCHVGRVESTALMPNLKFINVVVSTHDQYHAFPVNGY